VQKEWPGSSSPGPTLGADSLIEAQLQLLDAEGNLDGALSLARTLWDQTSSVRYIVGHRQRAALSVRVAMLKGDVDFARQVTAELEEGARRTRAPSALATALHCRGLLDQKPELLLEAAGHLRQTPRRLELARCHEDAATMLSATGRRLVAIETLTEAAALYVELGAAGDVERANALLRELGAARARRRAPRPAFGWNALTPTEITVANLAADGLTNPVIGERLYISRRTVEAHLSSIYRKLDVTNRTMLVSAIAAHRDDRSGRSDRSS